jgi:hypothetical protein
MMKLLTLKEGTSFLTAVIQPFLKDLARENVDMNPATATDEIDRLERSLKLSESCEKEREKGRIEQTFFFRHYGADINHQQHERSFSRSSLRLSCSGTRSFVAHMAGQQRRHICHFLLFLSAIRLVKSLFYGFVL